MAFQKSTTLPIEEEKSLEGNDIDDYFDLPTDSNQKDMAQYANIKISQSEAQSPPLSKSRTSTVSKQVLHPPMKK